MKTGSDHLRSLRDGRTILLNGGFVADPVDHPAYRQSIRSAAALYDYQLAPGNLEAMTFESPTSRRRVSMCWQLARSRNELGVRRRAMTRWAQLSCGMLGRSPDHVASCLAGMVMGAEVFDRYPGGRRQSLEGYFEYARDNDLFVTYVIANPQANKSKPASEQKHEFLVAGICDEDATGITVRGAKMLGTSTIMSNELLIGSIQPLRADEGKYAFTAAVPLSSKGLKLLSRRSYEEAASSQFDYPLSSRFDENDAVVYFDDVKIPWERVFVHRDPALSRAQFHETAAQAMMGHQAQVRLAVKLRFLIGLARKIAEANGIDGFAPVQERLGFLAARVSMLESMLIAMEAEGSPVGPYFGPNRRILHAAQAISQDLYPQIVLEIRDLAGGGLLMLPSSVQDLESEETSKLIDVTQSSPALSARNRVKLFKLAWDALGSEFGSRHLQYEMFYTGPSAVTRGNAFRSFDWDDAVAIVDNFLASYR